jgi:hypothetical protein
MNGAKKTTVKWQVYVETWRHLSGGGFGIYVSRSQQFDSTEEARGFAAGLSTNPYCRDVRIEAA